MADFHHHFLGGYRNYSSTKPRILIDLGTKKTGSRLERVEIQFGSIFMTVRKMPKMNLEWTSSSSSSYDISVPQILNYLKMLRFQ